MGQCLAPCTGGSSSSSTQPGQRSSQANCSGAAHETCPSSPAKALPSFVRASSTWEELGDPQQVDNSSPLATSLLLGDSSNNSRNTHHAQSAREQDYYWAKLQELAGYGSPCSAGSGGCGTVTRTSAQSSGSHPYTWQASSASEACSQPDSFDSPPTGPLFAVGSGAGPSNYFPEHTQQQYTGYPPHATLYQQHQQLQHVAVQQLGGPGFISLGLGRSYSQSCHRLSHITECSREGELMLTTTEPGGATQCPSSTASLAMPMMRVTGPGQLSTFSRLSQQLDGFSPMSNGARLSASGSASFPSFFKPSNATTLQQGAEGTSPRISPADVQINA